MIGKTLSHFKILDQLGKGGMGEVWLAHDSRLGRKVALKFLPPELQADKEARRRFLREAKAAAAIDLRGSLSRRSTRLSQIPEEA